MSPEVYVAALRVERQSCIDRGVSTVDVDAELERVCPAVIETASLVSPETAAVKRGPGRPRKESA